jgi:Spy/CpxP family protein refolding chaperone
MVISRNLKIYGIVLGIFVLGAGAGGAAGYAVASKKLAEVLENDRPDMNEARRFQALARELDLDDDQRKKVRGIMERHRDENRKLTRAMVEKCGGELQELRSRVDGEIRAVLTEKQAKRFGELMEKRRKLFPLGGPGGGRFRKGDHKE